MIEESTDEAIITATVKTPVVLIIGEAPDVRLKTPRRKDKLPFLQQLPHQKCWEKELEEEKIIFSLRQHKRNCQFILKRMESIFKKQGRRKLVMSISVIIFGEKTTLNHEIKAASSIF